MGDVNALRPELANTDLQRAHRLFDLEEFLAQLIGPGPRRLEVGPALDPSNADDEHDHPDRHRG